MAISSFVQLAQQVDYSLMDGLRPDPEAKHDRRDDRPREVLSGHYVPVRPTPLSEPELIAHSSTLFRELDLSEGLVHDPQFLAFFAGDMSVVRAPMRPYGWATGYALSIYGKEYTQQCPFGTGNGYGDGRALSVFEGLFKGQRWELQLKGAGPTPYCRGGDGRAVLRSSLREFLAQEFMHALGVPTTRSLTLVVSRLDTVRRPWYSPHSRSIDPDILVETPAAITTRVAPSFLRVGQLELFARRARQQTHPDALLELRMIVKHLIERNYRSDIDPSLEFNEQLLELATLFRARLTSLVANWMRVGYCQGNFNSDNCAAGGYTLDYGPFGFCELFDLRFQPWTGGGDHFCFFNQPAAAEANFEMFWASIRLLLVGNSNAEKRLDAIREGFARVMQQKLDAMWASKLGLNRLDSTLLNELLQLMLLSKVDYTIFFRLLSEIPQELSALEPSFYEPISETLADQWAQWLQRWHGQLAATGNPSGITAAMQRVNPQLTWREWMVSPVYQQAELGDNSLIGPLHQLLSNPYEIKSPQALNRDDRLKPSEYFNVGGVSHYSCSS